MAKKKKDKQKRHHAEVEAPPAADRSPNRPAPEDEAEGVRTAR